MFQIQQTAFQPTPLQPPVSLKPVQKRTKAACVHCQSAKVACSSQRPCVWCIRHGLQETCVDAPKKERKRKTPDVDTPDPQYNQQQLISVVPTQQFFFSTLQLPSWT